jgi:hypothetical protein
MDEVSDPAISVLAEGISSDIHPEFCLILYIPVRVYGNSDVQKLAVYTENKGWGPPGEPGPPTCFAGKSGIYL